MQEEEVTAELEKIKREKAELQAKLDECNAVMEEDLSIRYELEISNSSLNKELEQFKTTEAILKSNIGNLKDELEEVRLSLADKGRVVEEQVIQIAELTKEVEQLRLRAPLKHRQYK